MQINITKKHFWVLAALVLFGIGVFVYAQAQPHKNDPDAFGHDYEELNLATELECHTIFFDDKNDKLVSDTGTPKDYLLLPTQQNPGEARICNPQTHRCNFFGHKEDWKTATLPNTDVLGGKIYGLKCKTQYETVGCGFYDHTSKRTASFIWDNVCGTFEDHSYLELYSEPYTGQAMPGFDISGGQITKIGTDKTEDFLYITCCKPKLKKHWQ